MGNIIRFGDIRRFKPDSRFLVNWMLTRRCNYKCGYCKVVKNDPFPDLMKKFDIVKDNLERIPRDDVLITMTGGEPMICPGYSDFVGGLLNSDKLKIKTVTNLSRSSHWIQKFVELSGCDRHQFMASFHTEFADEKKFTEKVKIILDSGTDISVHIICNPLKMDIAKGAFERISKVGHGYKRFSIRAKGVHDKTSVCKEYSENDLKWIEQKTKKKTGALKDVTVSEIINGKEKKRKEATLDWLIHNKHTFKGWMCYLGHSQAVIATDGGVNAAVCERKRKADINIFEPIDDWSIIQRKKICKTKWCWCIIDMRNPKADPNYEYPEGVTL